MIRIREYEDWIELYDNETLLFEGHRLGPQTLLRKLQIDFEYEYVEGDSDEYDDDIFA